MPPNQLDPDVVNLTKAIRETESGGNFGARGASGEYGAYQYTPDTWNGVAKKYGINVPLEQASPRQQNEVTYKRLKEWKDAGYNVGQIASMWNAGEGRPNAYRENWKGVNDYGVAYDTPAYAKKVATAYQGIKSTQRPAQALGQSVAANDPIQNIARGVAAFPSKASDPIGTSLLKTAGNLPGSTYNLARNIVAPVNPLDLNHPLNIGANLYKSSQALSDIYGNRGAIQGTKDIVGGFGRTIGKGINFVDDKLSGAFRMTQERGLGGALAEGTGRVAEMAINDPTIIPSLLYSPRALGGRDLIADVASPVTKPIARVGEAVATRADDATVANREAALVEVDNKYIDRQKVAAAAPDRWANARRMAAESDVLTKKGVVDENGKIVGANQAAKAYKSQEIGQADKVVEKLLEREGVGIPLELLQKEITRTVKESLDGAELVTALNKIQREMAGLRLKNKDGRITLKDVHRLKVKTQPLSRDYLRPRSARYNKQLARGYKETVEKYSKEKIRPINAEIQKYLETADYIAGLQNKIVDGGKLGKAVSRIGGAVGGAVVGGAIGGLPGVAAGSYIGGAISNKLAGRSMAKKFGKPTKRPSKPNKVLQEAIKRATEDRKQLALPAPRPKKLLALPPGRKEVVGGPVIQLRPSKSMEKGVDKLPYLDSLDEKVLKKMAEEPLEIPAELKQYLNISDDVEEVTVKAKNELPDNLEGRLVALQLQKEALDSHPAKALSKFVAKRGEFKGQLAEQGKTKGGFGIDERISEATQGAYDTVEEARDAYLKYIQEKQRFAAESKAVMAEIKEYKAKNKKPSKARELFNAAKENLKNPQTRQGGYALNKPKIVGEKLPKLQKSSSLNNTPQKLGVANPAQNLADAKQSLKEAKGLSPSDIVAKSPDINMKRDTPVTDVYGKKSVIPAGEALTPYELKGNKVLLQDGETYIVSKNQWQNVKGQSVTSEAVPFAPELKGTVETVKGANNKTALDRVQEFRTKKTMEHGTSQTYNWPTEDINELERLQRAADTDTGRVGDTKYSQYTLPGGENYREILVQAPANKLESTLDEEAKKLGRIRQNSGNYKSSHWSEPNVISHIRMNERTVDGKKYAFMEELQSDWAREGRDKGFVSTKEDFVKTFEIKKEVSPKSGKELYIAWKDGSIFDVEDTRENLVKLLEKRFEQGKGTGVPNNPLLKDWQIPTTKRALIEAVDSGADRFAWINGEQTSARYNLATHVDEVDWKKSEHPDFEDVEGIKEVTLKPKGGGLMTVDFDSTGTIVNTQYKAPDDWNGKKLDEVLGKGLADKIMEKETGTLSGEGLSFGGEWAKNLYDRQVRDIVKKLTGAEVKTVDMGLGNGKKTREIINTTTKEKLKPEEIKVGGKMALRGTENQSYKEYVITEVKGEGKFKAVPKQDIKNWVSNIEEEYNFAKSKGYNLIRDEDKIVSDVDIIKRFEKEFNKSESFDTSNVAIQQYIDLTPEVKARIKGQAVPLKPASGRLPFKPEPLKAA